MNLLVIHISESCLRAILSKDGIVTYCNVFDIDTLPTTVESETTENSAYQDTPAYASPYLIFSEFKDKKPWDSSLKRIIRSIKTEIACSIDATYIILPSHEVLLDTHQLPKMGKLDAQKLIGRKIGAELKEEFPPLSVLPAASDQKIQNWISLYVPTATLREYRKAFASCGIRIKGITTSINAMLDAFSSVREAIFNAHVVFEIQHGIVEAYYISSDGLLCFQKSSYTISTETEEYFTEEEVERAQKQKIFKIINTIFSINSYYLMDNPNIPVQMAWVCGLETGLDEIAVALKDAMAVEVVIAPPLPSGKQNETGYVPLIGFVSSIQKNSATFYNTPSFIQRFPLQKTYGIAIYTITGITAGIALMMTEREYQVLKKQVIPVNAINSKDNKGKNVPTYLKSLDVLKKLTAQQFVFYPLFREFANRLPDGAIIENMEYKFIDNKGVIVITIIALLGNKVDTTEIPSKIMNVFDASPLLGNHLEPVISTVVKDNTKYLKFVFGSEVKPVDSTN